MSFYLQVQINLVKNYVCPGPPRGGAGGGATSPEPQTSRGPQLEKYPKIEQGSIKKYKALTAILKALKASFIGILNALEYCSPIFSLVV